MYSNKVWILVDYHKVLYPMTANEFASRSYKAQIVAKDYAQS